MQPDSDPVRTILGGDDLARLGCLFSTFNSVDLDLRGIVLVLDALIAEHAKQPELVRDLLATRGIVADAISRNLPCLDGIAAAFQRVKAERTAAFDPSTARPADEAEQATAPLATLAVSKTLH